MKNAVLYQNAFSIQKTYLLLHRSQGHKGQRLLTLDDLPTTLAARSGLVKHKDTT
jgi:hypothetical protein